MFGSLILKSCHDMECTIFKCTLRSSPLRNAPDINDHRDAKNALHIRLYMIHLLHIFVHFYSNTSVITGLLSFEDGGDRCRYWKIDILHIFTL